MVLCFVCLTRSSARRRERQMRKQGGEAALPGLRCGVSLCPPSSLPAGTVLGACGGSWDQMCPFQREGDCGKQRLPLQSSPRLGRASGQALVSEEEPSPRADPKTSSVFSRAHSRRAGPFLTVSCALALQRTGHVRKVSPSSEARSLWLFLEDPELLCMP